MWGCKVKAQKNHVLQIMLNNAPAPSLSSLQWLQFATGLLQFVLLCRSSCSLLTSEIGLSVCRSRRRSVDVLGLLAGQSSLDSPSMTPGPAAAAQVSTLQGGRTPRGRAATWSSAFSSKASRCGQFCASLAPSFTPAIA